VKDAARAYLDAGLCVLPARRDVKYPALQTWGQYKERLPTRSEVDAWFANDHDALCIVTGAVSGNGEMIDFDFAGELFDPWCARVRAAAPGLLDKLVIEGTQSSGWHAAYRAQEKVCGSMKLAQRKRPARDEEITLNDKGMEVVVLHGKEYIVRIDSDGSKYVIITLIETRGEAGLFLCDPTEGYTVVQGDFRKLPVLTAEERDILLRCAWDLNEYVPPVADRTARAAPRGHTLAPGANGADPAADGQSVGGLRPGDDFSARGDVRAVLQQHGWTLVKGGENEYWCRPGKQTGTSATLKDGVFYVFSSNALPFMPNEPYAPFSVYALLEHGGDFEQAARALRSEGYGSDEPDDGDVDISAIVQAFGPQPRDDSDSAHDGPDIANPGPFPAHLLENLPELVKTAMDHYMTNAFEAQPVMFLASFLAATGTILGHKIKDASGLRTNIYTVGVLGTGGGKEATRETVDRIFQRAGLAPMCGAEDFASDSGMIKAVSIQNPILFQIDEFGRLMHSIQLGAKRSPHLYNIASALLKLYSKANGTFRSKAYADPKRNMRIDYPHVCVYGSTVVGNFWDALSYEAVKDGFLPRLMIFESLGENIEGQGLETEPPDELVEFFSYWVARRITSGNMERVFPSPMVVPYSPEAAKMMADFRAEQKREAPAYDELGPLWSRARENAGKLALIHACWTNSEQPIVETDSARWAVQVTRHVVRQTIWRASLSLVDNPFHAECQKVLQKLQKAPSGELSHSRLLKRMKMKAREFRELIQTLEQRRDIEPVRQSTSGRPGLFYRLRSRWGRGEGSGERVKEVSPNRPKGGVKEGKKGERSV